MNRRRSLQSLIKRSIDGPLVFLLLLPNGTSVGSKNMATASGGEQSAKSSGTGPLAAAKGKTESEFRSYWNSILRAEEEALEKTRPWQKLEYIPVNDQKSILSSVKGECLFNNYHFGGKPSFWRENIVARMVESHAVVKLQYPFGPTIAAPKGVDPTKWSEIFPQAQVYLLGCIHHSEESRKNAQNLMAAVQPDVAMIELCRERSQMSIGITEEELEADIPNSREEFYEKISKKYEQHYGKRLDDLGWFERRKTKMKLRLIYWVAMKVLGVLNASEQRATFYAAQRVPGCAGIVLGDLPLSSHPAEFLQKIMRKWWTFTMDKKLRHDIKTILVEKRDKHMVSVLHTMLHRCTIEKLAASERIGVEFEPVTAIAVVGESHLEGIEERWSKPEQVYPLQ